MPYTSATQRKARRHGTLIGYFPKRIVPLEVSKVGVLRMRSSRHCRLRGSANWSDSWAIAHLPPGPHFRLSAVGAIMHFASPVRRRAADTFAHVVAAPVSRDTYIRPIAYKIGQLIGRG